MMQKKMKMTETLTNGYSSENSQRELSNEYQHDRVSMFFKNICFLVHRTKVASALKGLSELRGRILSCSDIAEGWRRVVVGLSMGDFDKAFD